MKRFEYQKIIQNHQLGQQALFNLGQNGWEMCGCMVLPDGVYKMYKIYYFKRELLAEATEEVQG